MNRESLNNKEKTKIRGKMDNISALAIPAIISSGFLLYQPQNIEFLIYGFLIIFIAYIFLLRYLKKYKLHNYLNIFLSSIIAVVALLYMSKEGYGFVILGFAYVVFSVYIFNENLKEYSLLS